MTKQIILAIVITATMSYTSSAQSKNSDTDTTRSLLWEISGNGLNTPSYLFGTFHLMCKDDFNIKPKVKQALDKVGVLYLEINYTDPEEITAMQKMMTADKKLSEQLSPEKATELKELLKAYNLNLEEIDNYSVQALYSIIAYKTVTCPVSDIKMVDLELMTLALQSNIKILGLETVKEQLMFLDNAYSLDEAIEQLRKHDEYTQIFKEMVEAYKNEDLPALDKMLRNPDFMDSNAEKWMLTERNKNWAEKIPEIMAHGSVMFAVGSGHLCGKNGVITLLREKGYTVTPILE